MAVQYSEEVAKMFCERIADGRSINSVCSDEDMPCKTTFYAWLDEYESFRTKCARARIARAESRVEEMEEIVTSLKKKEIDSHSANVILSQLRWTASKENPAIYGDKLNLSGDMTIKTTEIPDEKLDAKLQALLDKAKEK